MTWNRSLPLWLGLSLVIGCSKQPAPPASSSSAPAAPSPASAAAVAPVATSSTAITGAGFQAWTSLTKVGANGQSVNAYNPEDPTKTRRVTSFKFDDGTLELRDMLKNPPGQGVEIRYAWTPGVAAKTVASPVLPLLQTPNTASRALALSAARQIFHGENWNILTKIGLTSTEYTKAARAYGEVQDAILQIDVDVAGGKFEPTEYAAMTAALEAFRATGSTDLAAAEKTFKLALSLYEKIKEAKLKKITAWADQTASTLTDDQKTKAQKAIESQMR